MRISDWSSDGCSADRATVLLADLDVEVGVQLLRRARVVGGAAGGKHRERAAAQQVVHAAARGVAQARDFLAREDVEAAARVDAGVDGRERGGFGVLDRKSTRLNSSH